MITQSRYLSVVDAVGDTVGDDFRVVAVVSEDGRGFHADLFEIRDDVAEEYTDDAIETIGDEMLFEFWSHEWHGELFQAGDVRYTLHRYDDATIVMCHRDDFAVVVSIDADADARADAIACAVHTALDEAQ